MQVIPVIELMSGQCVSLKRGDIADPSIWHVDPVQTAMNHVATGATWLHVTDFDALLGRNTHDDLIAGIIRRVGVPVQVSGGIRSMERAAQWIDKGAARVVIGSAAVQSPDLVRQMAHQYPDQIVLSLDVSDGAVMIDGWRTRALFSARDFLAAYDDLPLAAVIFTDIDADADHPEASLALTTRIATQCRAPVIASGTVKSLDDISRLKYVYNIAGCLVGRALMNKSIDLAAALRLASTPERVPEFQ